MKHNGLRLTSTIHACFTNTTPGILLHQINHKLEHHFLTTLTRYLEELDKADPEWPKKWNELRETYLAGHFILTRPTAWALPKDVVGAIKGGLRRDDGRYDHSTGELDGRKLADWKG